MYPGWHQRKCRVFPELSLPISQGPPPVQLSYVAGHTPLADQIVLEMAGGPPRPNSRMILNIASGLNTPGALQAFRYLAASSASDQNAVGLTGLIRAGDTNRLLAVEAVAAQPPPAADLIAAAIRFQFRSSDPIAVASLGRMATSSQASPIIANAAAQALVAIHSAAALAWLGKLLNGSSSSMQIYGAQG
jgi:hypothetical protein